jgi:hypothetical protein
VSLSPGHLSLLHSEAPASGTPRCTQTSSGPATSFEPPRGVAVHPPGWIDVAPSWATNMHGPCQFGRPIYSGFCSGSAVPLCQIPDTSGCSAPDRAWSSAPRSRSVVRLDMAFC